MIYFLIIGLGSIGYGIHAFLRPSQIAQKNRDYIDSGKESYFEERRSWKAYNNTPPTDDDSIKWRGIREILFGIVALILAAAFYSMGRIE